MKSSWKFFPNWKPKYLIELLIKSMKEKVKNQEENSKWPKTHDQKRNLQIIEVKLLDHDGKGVSRQRVRHLARKWNDEQIMASPIVAYWHEETKRATVVDGRIRVEAAKKKQLRGLPVIFLTKEEFEYVQENGLDFNLYIVVPEKVNIITEKPNEEKPRKNSRKSK